MTLRGLLCAAALLLASSSYGALSGKLVSTGSDTLGALSTLWAQGVMTDNPAVRVQVRAVGSSAAPTALVQGTSDIGPMSRPMTSAELRNFFSRYGYAPTAVPVAVDTLAVFVHRDNPLQSIRREQLDALFSSNRRCGATTSISTWGSLGVGGRWRDRYVTVYGRSATSGTYGFFRRHVLCGGDFSARVNRLVGSAAVVRAVGDDLTSVGYASAGFVSNSVRRLRVLDEQAAEINLSRDLLLYINLPPDRELSDLLQLYLREALGDPGQAMVRAAGYTPLSRARRNLIWGELRLGPAL